jgi:PKD repeat protein
MRFAAAVMAFAFCAGSAIADAPDGCPTLTQTNVFITWASASGTCTRLGGPCFANDSLNFDVGTFGYSLSCTATIIQWDFGDRTSANGKNVMHRYAAPGTYNVTLRLTTPSQSTTLTAAVTVLSSGRRRVARKSPSPPPLDEQTIKYLSLELGQIDARPGDTRQLRLLAMQCCVLFNPIYADVRYYADPGDFARVDPISGLLTIDSGVPGGAKFRVYANIENGRRIVSADVYVDTVDSNPLRGTWTQVGEIPCDGSSDIAAVNPLNFLHFAGGNSFDATWIPFEVYKDYWGVYSIDTSTKQVMIGATAGNYVPTTIDGAGTYELIPEAGGTATLRLNNVWLGRPGGDARPPACGMVFHGHNW